MSKINIKISILNNETNNTLETLGIKDDNKIKYKEKDGTLTIIDLDNYELIRDNNELRMNYIFKENEGTTGTITIKEYNKNIDVVIKTNKVELNNNNISIEYEIENNKFIYRLEEIK